MSGSAALDSALRETIRAAVLAAAETPQVLKQLKDAAKAAVTGKKDKKPAESVVDEMIEAGELHKQSLTPKTTPKTLFGKNPPPLDKVRAALLAAAAQPQTLADLITAATAATGVDKTFVADEANKLIATEQLHKQSAAKNAPYGRDKPPLLNDPEKVRTALLEAANQPQTLTKLIAAAATATGADKAFVTEEANKLIAAEQLHKQSAAEKAPYGREKPPLKNDPEKVRSALLDAAEQPQPLNKLIAAAVAATKADKEFVAEEANKLIAAEQLHKQSAAEKAPYGKTPPPLKNDPEKVRAALLDAATQPQTLSQLVAAAKKVTGADKEFVAEEANKLIAAEQLHKQAAAQNAPYGREKPKPPHPLETGPGKTAFGKLVTASRNLLESVKGVEVTELLDRLRAALLQQPPPPPVPPPPVSHPVEPAPHQLGSVLKTAYDELCRDVEFQDKVVELRALYHEVAKTVPGLTAEQFHRELEHLQNQQAIDLQPLNEVQRAKEPKLAIQRGDRLLYFVIWR